MSYDFLVNRAELAGCRLEAVAVPGIGSGEVLLRVDRFALTANNITYGVAGDVLGYWRFFPAPGNWGRIPAWGIGTVVDSRAGGITRGSRYYGYFPMSSHLQVTPGKVTPVGFTDCAAHRHELPPVYNHYALMSDATGFPERQDNQQMVYRPLFTTSFMLDDFFGDNACFGAEQIVLASASSKTAFGTAFLMRGRPQKIVGLTSKANRAFVKGLGLYDQVVTYDEATSLDASHPTAYIDMSGNRQVLARVHHHFCDKLVNSCAVGITHYDSRGGEDPATLPGARPVLFFAPSQVEKRRREWGADEYQRKVGEAWRAFVAAVDDWVRIVEAPAPAQLEEVYTTVLNGAAPDKAYVLIN
jgi:hypothetical protein